MSLTQARSGIDVSYHIDIIFGADYYAKIRPCAISEIIQFTLHQSLYRQTISLVKDASQTGKNTSGGFTGTVHYFGHAVL